MSAYLDLAEFLTSLNLLYRSKAQINAGAGKNDPDDVRTLLTNMIETTFANEGGAPTVITEVTQELTFGSNQVMGINDRDNQSGSYSFTLAGSGNTPGYVIQVYIQANGSGTFTFSSDFVILNSSVLSGGVLTNDVTYLFSFLYDGDKVLVNVVETNAAPVDVTPPTLSSATIQDSTDNTLDLVFDQAVNITTAGWSISTDGAALSISAVASGSGTTTPKFTLSRSILSTETITISYDSSTGNTADEAGNELADITNRAVTNNVVDLENIVWTAGGANAVISTNNLDSSSASPWDQSYARATKTLPISTDGNVQAAIQSTSIGCILGFDASPTITAFNAFDYSVFVAPTGNYFTFVGATSTDSGIAWANGDLYRIRRESGNIIAEYYRGGSWSTIRNFSVSQTGLYYVHGFARDSTNDGVKDAKHSGLTT